MLGMLKGKGEHSGLSIDSDFNDEEEDEGRLGLIGLGRSRCVDKFSGINFFISISKFTCEMDILFLKHKFFRKMKTENRKQKEFVIRQGSYLSIIG